MNRSPFQLFEGIQQKDIRSLSQGITLIESTRPQDRASADQLIELCNPLSGNSHRIGVTGVPGVGKSTFIERSGLRYCEEGHRLAVLAVDPSSARSGGAILGDKTRMEKLSAHPNAFIRPSAAANSLGGVARKTREAIILCEAAGFDMVMIETVGVGQSETQVRSMVDTFILLILAGAGDELQGIKRGIMEMADLLLVNKVEDEQSAAARESISDHRSALHLLGDTLTGWSPQVGSLSSLTGRGMDQVFQMIAEHRLHLDEGDRLKALRSSQDLEWYDQVLRQAVYQRYLSDDMRRRSAQEWRQKVSSGEVSPLVAVRKVLQSD